MECKKGLLSREPFAHINELKRSENGNKIRHRTLLRPTRAPMISIIIPAHNEEDYIGLTLDALRQQNYPHFEIIVVANGCSDTTAEVALKCCHRLVVLSDKGLGVSRNLGAKLARGEILMFLDADTLLEPGALQTVANQFTRKYASGTFRGCPDIKTTAFQMIYGLKNFMHCSGIHHGSSGVILCWRKDFLAVHGFDEALQIRENSELMHRLSQFGKYRYISETSAMTSMRRYENVGTKKMLFYWFKLWIESLFRDLRHKEYETVR